MVAQRFIGIDLSKRNYEAVAIIAGEELIVHWNGKLDFQGRLRLLDRLHDGDVVALEAGTGTFKLATELQSKSGLTVLVLNAANLAVIYASLKKTDKEDALKLARLVQKFSPEELPIVPIPTVEEMERRALVAHESSLRHDRLRLINRLHAVFARSGFPNHTRAELKNASVRAELIEQELVGFSKVAGGNLHQFDLEYVAALPDLQVRIHDEVSPSGDDSKILMSIPGFGLKTTMAILAYAGDMRRFDTPGQLVNYIGFSPRIYSSGDVDRRGAITKRGNSLVRGMLVQSAWGLIRTKSDNPLKKRYQAMIARGKAKSVAIVATARKLTELVYVLLSRKQYCWHTGEVRLGQKLEKAGILVVGVGSC